MRIDDSIRGALVRAALAFTAAIAVGMACHEDDGLEGAGRSCEDPGECYPEADHDAIAGEVLCLGAVEGGYCTHRCTADTDCCAAPGECEDGLPQVCSPFESTGDMMCFLSCEDADVEGADPAAYCHEHAHPAFGCRSSGGGNLNRKVCVP